MSGISQIPILESMDFLQTLLQEQKKLDAFQKIQVLYLLKSQQVTTITEVATLVGKHRVTVQNWLHCYHEEGIEGLLRHKPRHQGRKSVIPDEVIAKLQTILAQESRWQSYQEIQLWLEDEIGQSISYAAVYYLVRKKLNLSFPPKSDL